ncbi:hypothetical protein [Nannocystis sp. SCPEA4]|uniref:hypothetical protein n=1 Tax=Nannocystis sp. SCPEA4 TaxID=2996787 RepID=UPI00226E9A88|nr:hypothetical protein [Nannocystis sp. SCPEA4]MCY1055414.1 hypothetical protein [Nannocystis sp. SCPEA4]
MSSTTNPIYIDGTRLEIPQDRAVSITTSSGIRIELAAQPKPEVPKPEPTKVVEEPAKKEKKRYKLRGRARIQEDRLRVARAIARAGSRGITLAELRDRLGLPTMTLTNDLLVLRQAGLIEAHQETDSLIGQVLRYTATPRVSQ